ncbi:MAG: glycerophosphodiester phosphodiesterase [Acidimicrobiia bacterium]|nr:glycerophosphodiester phosphodiesterase [Acidimicrobiia bacterium]
MPHPSGRPWIAAHRGASRLERENTLAAFLRAVVVGADAVEMDARRTRDGEIVVHHDATLGGEPLISLSRAEVARRAPWIPDLADAIAACVPAWVDLEIKNSPGDPDWDPDDAVLDAAAPLIDRRIVVTSFNPTTVARAHALGMRCGRLLGWGDHPGTVLSEWPGYEFVLPSQELVPPAASKGFVAAAGAVGASVGIWTIDDAETMRAYAAAGVDLIFTNVPDVAVGTLAR